MVWLEYVWQSSLVHMNKFPQISPCFWLRTRQNGLICDNMPFHLIIHHKFRRSDGLTDALHTLGSRWYDILSEEKVTYRCACHLMLYLRNGIGFCDIYAHIRTCIFNLPIWFDSWIFGRAGSGSSCFCCRLVWSVGPCRAGPEPPISWLGRAGLGPSCCWLAWGDPGTSWRTSTKSANIVNLKKFHEK